MTPALVCVAHGSRDPRSAATVAGLVDIVRALRPSLDVRLAFLDLSAPRLGDVLAGVAGDGHREAVVVPLLLGSAYHARVDVPAAVHAATSRSHSTTFRSPRANLPAGVRAAMPGSSRLCVSIADVLGPDPRLGSAALRRLAAAGVSFADRSLGVVLAAAGSAHQPANAAVADVADDWARQAGWAGVVPAFAAAATPTVAGAIAELRRRGARRIAVAQWFLAPGVLPDRVLTAARAADPAVLIAEPLGTDPEVAQIILDRHASAAHLLFADEPACACC